MALSEDHDDVSATFIRMPNELKLMFAEELEIHDVNALSRTCRQMNKLLVRFMYGRAKDSMTHWNRPYFLSAVDHGNLAAVEWFVEAGASVNMTDTVTKLPETAIHSYAYFGHLEIAKFLINKGINVSAVDVLGNRALHSVVTGMHPKEAMMTLLVEAGADLKATWNCATALHKAARIGNVRMVQCLLDLGADMYAGDQDGVRPLHAAAAYSRVATVRCLLEAGQNPEIPDHEGRTPLHVAAQYGGTECVKVLLEMGAKATSVDMEGSTPLQYALYAHGNDASVHRILHLAASMADQLRVMYAECVPSCRLLEPNHSIIEILLAAGADIMQLDGYDDCPLGWAAARANTTSLVPGTIVLEEPDYLIGDDHVIGDDYVLLLS